jgi:hypothetical protein
MCRFLTLFDLDFDDVGSEYCTDRQLLVGIELSSGDICINE